VQKNRKPFAERDIRGPGIWKEKNIGGRRKLPEKSEICTKIALPKRNHVLLKKKVRL